MTQTLISGGPVHNYKFKRISARGGSSYSYPWLEKAVNEWFFKAVSKEDLDKDKGRPGVPNAVRDAGIKWKTERVYCEETKQYGYLCTRMK